MEPTTHLALFLCMLIKIKVLAKQTRNKQRSKQRWSYPSQFAALGICRMFFLSLSKKVCNKMEDNKQECRTSRMNYWVETDYGKLERKGRKAEGEKKTKIG